MKCARIYPPSCQITCYAHAPSHGQATRHPSRRNFRGPAVAGSRIQHSAGRRLHLLRRALAESRPHSGRHCEKCRTKSRTLPESRRSKAQQRWRVAAGSGEADSLGDHPSRRFFWPRNAGRRRAHHEDSRTAVGHQDRRLRSCPDCRCQAPRCGRVSCGLARHRSAHRGKRCGRNAAAVWQPAARSARRDRAVHPALLLFGGSGSARGIRIAIHLRGRCVRRSVRLQRDSREVSAAVPESSARLAMGTWGRRFTSIWWKRIAGNCSTRECAKRTSASSKAAPPATRRASSRTAQSLAKPEG